MQYGIPGFRELLARIYSNFSRESVEEVLTWDEGRLRSLTENLFRVWDSRTRRQAIKKTFPPVRGEDCGGYLRLARLQPYTRAILNMNFDLLLEEAWASLGEPPKVFYNFNKLQSGAICKICGTVKERGGEPIIGIDESHIFKDSKEYSAVIDLLTRNHVVILGYSGGDEKILHALRSVPDEDSEMLTNLFVINLSGPGNRLPHIQRKRRSEWLVLEGAEAGFENFMEGLEQAFNHPEDASVALEGVWEVPIGVLKCVHGIP
jgi:hypothetical protein